MCACLTDFSISNLCLTKTSDHSAITEYLERNLFYCACSPSRCLHFPDLNELKSGFLICNPYFLGIAPCTAASNRNRSKPTCYKRCISSWEEVFSIHWKPWNRRIRPQWHSTIPWRLPLPLSFHSLRGKRCCRKSTFYHKQYSPRPMHCAKRSSGTGTTSLWKRRNNCTATALEWLWLKPMHPILVGSWV